MAWNVKADNWTNGEFVLKNNVETWLEADYWASICRERYQNQPYPNGKGFYNCRNFRAVEVPSG